jgi:alpha-tubulin suppressor-like RCC1 family protein
VVALAGEAIDVEAGGEHTCALLVSGAVQCWGNNAQRQLGHAGTGPGTVPLPEPVASIAMGAEHGCAVTETSEQLHCWGSDAHGQLGVGTDSSAGIRRVDLGGQGAMAVFAGANASTTFAVLADGGLRGWGRNDAGQAGYGDLLDGEDETWRVGELPDIPIFRAPK